jgi:hypothetical protein
MPDLRRQRRVTYHTNIRLRPAGREESVVARVQNLSASGLFVTAAQVPPAGTDVLCRMLVAGERCTLKGRIAWVRSPAPGNRSNGVGAGAGIGFVDLSARHSELLERLLEPALNGNGVDPADRVAADVWFEGLSTPIRSQALVNDENLSIATKLPFLRLSSPVRLSFVRRGVEEVRTGTLEAVTLEPSSDDGVPRLHLTVQTPPLASAQGTIEVRDIDLNTVLNAHHPVRREPRTVVDPAAVGPSHEGAAPSASPTLVDVPPVTATPMPGEAPPVSAPLSHEATQRVKWADQPDQIVPVPPSALVAVAAARARRQEMSWRWAVAGGAVLVVAIGGIYAAARAPAPVAHLVRPGKTPPLEIERMPEAALVPTQVNVAAAALAEPSGPVIKQMPSPEPAAPASTAEPSSDSEDGIAVGKETDSASMTIALVGSSKGMMYYRLAAPAGVVVNLPRAYPRSSEGVHGNLPGAFKKVVIQRKGAGSVLRVYHRDADLTPQVVGDKVGLRVTLKAKRPPRS